MEITPHTIQGVAKARLDEGMGTEETRSWLVRNGVPESHAVEAIQKVQTRDAVSVLQKQALGKANRRLWFGIALFVAGLAITLFTYARAEVGESYTVWWGALVVGVLAMGQGIWARVRMGRTTKRVLADLA